MSRTVRIFDSSSATIVRVEGRVVRDAATGRHKKLVAYVPADASTADVVRELRAAAEQLAKTLPRLES